MKAPCLVSKPCSPDANNHRNAHTAKTVVDSLQTAVDSFQTTADCTEGAFLDPKRCTPDTKNHETRKLREKCLTRKSLKMRFCGQSSRFWRKSLHLEQTLRDPDTIFAIFGGRAQVREIAFFRGTPHHDSAALAQPAPRFLILKYFPRVSPFI